MADDQQMYDLAGWQQVPCEVADLIRHNNIVRVFSSLTDPDGHYGQPVIYTEWGIPELSSGDMPIMREYRWPEGNGEPPRCAHYVPAVDDGPLPALEPSIEGTHTRAGGAVDWRAEWAALRDDLARPMRWWRRRQAQRDERMGTEQ